MPYLNGIVEVIVIEDEKQLIFLKCLSNMNAVLVSIKFGTSFIFYLDSYLQVFKLTKLT